MELVILVDINPVLIFILDLYFSGDNDLNPFFLPLGIEFGLTIIEKFKKARMDWRIGVCDSEVNESMVINNKEFYFLRNEFKLRCSIRIIDNYLVVNDIV